MELIDTHVHLTMPDYGDNLLPLLARAKEHDVFRCVVPGLNLATSIASLALHQRYPETIPAVGLHPLSEDEDLRPFQTLAEDKRIKAIGEIGTDSKAGEWEAQEARFRHFLELAIKVKKPALIHIRETWEETLKILADYPELKGRAVIHCFTGGPHEAQTVAKLGLLLSFTAIIARSGMEKTQEVIKMWPLDQMMLETDGPWLSWPGDIWPNEPKTVRKVAEFIAELKGLSTEEIAVMTTKTAQTFLSLTI